MTFEIVKQFKEMYKTIFTFRSLFMINLLTVTFYGRIYQTISSLRKCSFHFYEIERDRERFICVRLCVSTGNLLYPNLMCPGEYTPNKGWFVPNFYVINTYALDVHTSWLKSMCTQDTPTDTLNSCVPKTMYTPTILVRRSS